MKKLMLMMGLMVVVGCGGGSSEGGLAGDDIAPLPDENALTYYDSYTYFGYPYSTCEPGSVYDKVLTAYTNETFTKFELQRADNSVFLRGDLDEDLIYTFEWYIGEEPADCFLQVRGTSFYYLHEECKSASYDCEIEWR